MWRSRRRAESPCASRSFLKRSAWSALLSGFEETYFTVMILPNDTSIKLMSRAEGLLPQCCILWLCDCESSPLGCHIRPVLSARKGRVVWLLLPELLLPKRKQDAA